MSLIYFSNRPNCVAVFVIFIFERNVVIIPNNDILWECEQGREKQMFGIHRVMMSTESDDELYTPNSVHNIPLSDSSGRSSHSPVRSTLFQYGSMFHPDYRRIVDMYRPFAAPSPPQIETGLQYEGQADTVAMRQCRYTDSVTTPTVHFTQNQQAFGTSNNANDYLGQPKSRNGKVQHKIFVDL